MDIEDLYLMWKKDGEIDESNLSGEASRIPKLHNEYFKLYTQEGLKLRKLKASFKTLNQQKLTYYRGEMDLEQLKELNWPPYSLRLLKTEVPQYVDSDKDIIKQTLIIGYQEELVSYLESIIKQINNRNFLLKTIGDWERFRNGG